MPTSFVALKSCLLVSDHCIFWDLVRLDRSSPPGMLDVCIIVPAIDS